MQPKSTTFLFNAKTYGKRLKNKQKSVVANGVNNIISNMAARMCVHTQKKKVIKKNQKSATIYFCTCKNYSNGKKVIHMGTLFYLIHNYYQFFH